MNRSHRELLKKNRYRLGKDLCVDDGLLNYLQQHDILTDSMREQIETEGEKKGSKRRSSVLLDILPMRGPNALPCFVEGLYETKQDHLARLLDTSLGSSSPVSPQSPPYSSGRPNPGAACGVARSSHKPTLNRTISQPSDENVTGSPVGHIDTPHGHPEETTCEKHIIPSGLQLHTPLQGSTETAAGGELQQESEKYKSIDTLDTKQTFVNISISQPEASDQRSQVTEKEYKIVGGSCGVAFIIEAENNEFIRDGINIGQLLENLNYKVQTIKLKVGEDIANKLESKRTMEELKSCHSLICYIFVDSTHNSLNLEGLCRVFDDQACPGLTGKPRVFIIQHSNRDIGVTCASPDDVDEMSGEGDSGKTLTAVTSGLEQLTITDAPSDTLVAYAQCTGKCEEDYSSFMVLAVVEVFMACAKNSPIHELMQEVEDLIKRTDDIKPGAFSMKITNRLQKFMYLLPPPQVTMKHEAPITQK